MKHNTKTNKTKPLHGAHDLKAVLNCLIVCQSMYVYPRKSRCWELKRHKKSTQTVDLWFLVTSL